MTEKYHVPGVPEPAEKDRRKEPLPWQQPKPGSEDPDAPARQQSILNSPSYRLAIEDTEFLSGYAARGVRMQLDYMKPERIMGVHGIKRTIVVFGSTRIVEPRAAQRKVDALRRELQDHADDEGLQQRLRIAERILAKSHYYDVAREFSRLAAEAGLTEANGELVVMTGGGPGIMEAANRGAYDAGAPTVGLNITLPHEQYPNPYITPELCFQFHYFAMRKMHFLMRARAMVAFPGGFGTFDELFETLTLVQTRKIKPLPIVLVGREYWRRILDADYLVEEGVIDSEDRDLFWFAETAEEIWQGLLCWYERNGESLLEPGGGD